MSDIDISGWVCPMPLRDYPQIVLGHGGGGKLSGDLVEHLYLPAFQNDALASLADGAALTIGGARLAFSTDSYVVRPLFFPGGSIADLAINGTVNDLSMLGARPLFLSVGLIIEEGLPMSMLGALVERLGAAARAAGVQVVTGDTKVVDKGHGDGVYINTSGIGLIPEGVHIAPQNARPGDVVLVSGTLGDHGMAIMSVREGLEFETLIQSDSAPLNGLVAAMLAVTPEIHVLRDPTRGGLASSLNEIARAAGVGVLLEDQRLPVRPEVSAACELLGMDPVYVANEGKLIAIVPPEHADAMLDAMRQHPYGKDAARIGQVVADHPGMVVSKTGIGGTRVVSMQIGEQLPRIC
ncbi:MAG: hydrogenase expression/formation protein HypE [Chloroflexi bacterium]|uniref:hydrogenase expression/formation protein HypE n=1 Tax=Candidatus Flexifilum breve TaxID=3140694 RepID=UPI003135813C|nr:hydrogenase expression/formation protein HypE [Chloroflexota bacterium]